MTSKRYMLTEPECYEALYGSLILYVNHYKIKINTNPGAVNLMPEYLSKHIYIPEEKYHG